MYPNWINRHTVIKTHKIQENAMEFIKTAVA
jgi:hypothetical protein